MSTPEKKPYELTAACISMLEDILPTSEWYKDDPKQGLLLVRGVDAYETLPDLGERPRKLETESVSDFEARGDAWGERVFQFEWTDKERDAVKHCVKHYLKKGVFRATANTKALLHFLSLHDE